MDAKMRCRKCVYLNWDFVTDERDMSCRPYFCGLHGCAQVDPEGIQADLDHRGSCGYWPLSSQKVGEQLELFD